MDENPHINTTETHIHAYQQFEMGALNCTTRVYLIARSQCLEHLMTGIQCFVSGHLYKLTDPESHLVSERVQLHAIVHPTQEFGARRIKRLTMLM